MPIIPAPTIEFTKLELAPIRPDFVVGMLILETLLVSGDLVPFGECGAGSVLSTAMDFTAPLALARDGSGLPGSSGVPSMLVTLYVVGDEGASLSNYTIHKRYLVKKTSRDEVTMILPACNDCFRSSAAVSHFVLSVVTFIKTKILEDYRLKGCARLKYSKCFVIKIL
jgi:hypothetical protein